MKLSKEQAIIESMLFAAGREVNVKEFMNVLELGAEDIDKIILNMKTEYDAKNSGIEIIKVNDNYKLYKTKICVIHGKGYGILRQKIHQSLKNNKLVLRYYLYNMNIGCTIIELKERK